MIVSTDQSLFSQSPSQFTANINIWNWWLLLVCIKCVCVVVFVFSRAAKNRLSTVHVINPLNWCTVCFRVCPYMLLFNIHIPLRSCSTPLIWNYFDILKPAESTLIHSSTSATAVLSDKAPQALRSAGEVQHATSSPLETERPLPGWCVALRCREEDRRGVRWEIRFAGEAKQRKRSSRPNNLGWLGWWSVASKTAFSFYSVCCVSPLLTFALPF